MKTGLKWVRGVLWIAVVAAGCTEREQSPGPAITRDSAGIQLVETDAEARFETHWTLATEPEWAIGQIEGDPEYLLSRVAGAMQLPTGEIVVANGGTNELRFYDSDGLLTRTQGGEGEGPGEFEYIRGLGECLPDGFVAFDLNWQMNAYEYDGTFIEKTTLRTPVGVTPYELACDPHGHILMIGWGRDATEGPIQGFYQSHDHLLLTTHDGAIETDFDEWLVSERIGSRFGSRPHPAGRATVFDLHEELVFVGTGEFFEVEVRDLGGTIQRIVRGPSIFLELTDAIKDLVLEVNLRGAAPDRHPEIRQEFASLEWPERFPAFTDLRVDPEELIWLRAYSADPDQPEIWSLLHPERGYLGDLSLQHGQNLLEIGSEYILVLSKDELDVERVEKYALRRTPIS